MNDKKLKDKTIIGFRMDSGYFSTKEYYLVGRLSDCPSMERADL